MEILNKIKEIDILVNYKKIWPYVKPYRTRAVLALLITIPAGAMDATIAMLLKPYMDNVLLDKNADINSWIPIVIILLSALQSGINYCSTYLNAWVGQNITRRMKLDLFRKLMYNEISFFDKSTSGEVLFRFNTDAELASSGLLTNLRVIITQVFSSATLIFVLFWNSWILAIIAIAVLGVALYPLSQLRKRINDIMGDTVFSMGQVMNHYNEAFAGSRVITSYNLHNQQEKKFQETQSVVFNLGMKMTKKTGILSPMMHFITSIGIAIVVWLGGYLIVNNALTPGGFISFLGALLMLYTPMKSLGNNFSSLKLAIMAMERVFEILERDILIKSIDNPIKLERIVNGIEYKGVCFEYTADNPVLQDINIKIPVNKTVALVGNSGGGKTTMLSLLPRFYDVKEGSIMIDGIDIRDMDLSSLRDKIGVVFQDNFLFSGTIRENIYLGNGDATEEQLNSAVKNACLEEFVNSLEHGLETQIGERGVLLSGGQKQRIAIARAFIKDAPIVILDEATSALDNKSEAIVQQAIYNLMRDRTVFIIAHRLSTVREADVIIVVNYGRIVEVGKHDDLIKKPDSVYNELYKSALKT